MKITKQLNIPFTAQGRNSGNCGPCSIKMIADYYEIKHPKGIPYSVPSLNKICRVTQQWGCEKSDMNRALKRLGLKREKVTYKVIKNKAGKIPLLTLFIDENGEGHYAVIKGINQNQLIFQDSYWGSDFTRPLHSFKKQASRFDHWIWAISPHS